jgi:hypothetical protein
MASLFKFSVFYVPFQLEHLTFNFYYLVFGAGWNSSWTSLLLPNSCLWTILKAFVDKECWSKILFKQNALASGNRATGLLLSRLANYFVQGLKTTGRGSPPPFLYVWRRQVEVI